MVEETVAVDNQQVQQPVAEVVEQPKTEYQKNEQAAENYIQNKVGEYEGVKPQQNFDLGAVSEYNQLDTFSDLEKRRFNVESEIRKENERLANARKSYNYNDVASRNKKLKELNKELSFLTDRKQDLTNRTINEITEEPTTENISNLFKVSEFISSVEGKKKYDDNVREWAAEQSSVLTEKLVNKVNESSTYLDELSDPNSEVSLKLKQEAKALIDSGVSQEEVAKELTNKVKGLIDQNNRDVANLKILEKAKIEAQNPRQTYLEANANAAWNTAVANIPRAAGTVVAMLSELTNPEGLMEDIVLPLMTDVDVKTDNRTAVQKSADELYDSLSKVTDEISAYEDFRQDRFVGSVVGNVLQMSVLPMGVGIATKASVGSTMAQAIGFAVASDSIYKESLDAGLNKGQAMAVSATLGTFISLLEKYSFDEAVAVVNQTKALKDLAKEGVDVDGLLRKITKEFTDKDIVTGLARVSATEGATEGIQYIVEDAGKRIANLVYNGNFYYTPDNLSAYGEQIWENVKGGMLGGSLMYGGLKTVSVIADKAKNGESLQTEYSRAKEVLQTQEDLNKFNGYIDVLVADNTLSEEAGIRQKNTAQIIFETKSSIVNGLTETQAKKAFELIFEKKQIEQEIEGKDKALVQNELERIKNIDEELANVRNIKEEPKAEEQKPQEESKQERLQTEEESKQNGLQEQDGKVELESLKEGLTTTTKPVKIFKGLGGKKDLQGVRINAHDGVRGIFAAVDKDLANEYARGEGISEFELPTGTTIEVVEISGKGMSLRKYREAEVEAINNSKADVVKLITIDGIIKAGKKKQEQYIIKNQKLFDLAKPSATNIGVQTKTEDNAKEQQNIQMRPEGEQEQAEGASNSNMPEGNKAELQDGEVDTKEAVNKLDESIDEALLAIQELEKQEKELELKRKEEKIKRQALEYNKIREESKKQTEAELAAKQATEAKKLAEEKAKEEARIKAEEIVKKQKEEEEKIKRQESLEVKKDDMEVIAESIVSELSEPELNVLLKEVRKSLLNTRFVVNKIANSGEVKVISKLIKDYFNKKINTVSRDARIILEKIKSKIVAILAISAIISSSYIGLKNPKATVMTILENTPTELVSAISESGALGEATESFNYLATKAGHDIIKEEVINKDVLKEAEEKARIEAEEKARKERDKKIANREKNTFSTESVSKNGALIRTSQFPTAVGSVFIPMNVRKNRRGNGIKEINGTKGVGHFLLDFDPITGESHPYNKGMHETNKKQDAYVPVMLKNPDGTITVTYKRYSEVSSGEQIMSPLRQFRFSDISWNETKPAKGFKTAKEVVLKKGVINPYTNENGTYLIFTGSKDNYGRFSGGSVVFIFTDKNGETFARDFNGSVNQIEQEGRKIASEYGISESEITIGYHDVGSFSFKPASKNGTINTSEIDALNINEGMGGGALLVPESGTKKDNNIPFSSSEASLLGLIAMFSGGKRRRLGEILNEIKNSDKKESTINEIIDRANEFTDDEKFKIKNEILVKKKPRITKADIAEETEGLSNKEVIKQFVAEYEKSKNEEYKEKEAKLKEKAKLKAKEDKEARIIFKDFIKAALEELNISPTARTKVSKIATEAANVTARNLQSKVDAIIETLVRYELKQETNEIDALKRKIKKRISAGNFGNQTRAVNVILAIDKFDIPVKLIKQYNNLLSKLAANELEKSIDDINAVADFMQKWSEEIEKDLNDVEHLAAEYVAFKAKDKTSKKEFLEYLEEEKYTEDVITYADENFDRIKAKAKENVSNEKPTTEERIDKIKKEKKEAVERFEEEMKALKDNKVEIDLDKYQDEKAKEIAATFKAITADNLIDLSAREIAMIPRIIDNISKGMMTPSAYRIAEKIEGSIAMNDFNDPKFKRAFINGQKVVVELAAALREFIDNRRADIIKDPKKLSDRFIKESLASFDNFVKGLKGNKIYEIINRYTSAKDVYITETNVFKNRINQLFYSAKGGEMYNNTLLSVYMRAREEINNPNSKTIRKAIEYVNETLKGASNNEKKDVLSAIRDKFFDNGVPDMNAMKAEIDKNGLNKLIDYVDSMFEKNILPKAQFLSEIKRGKAFADIKGYSPRGTVRDADISSVEQRFNNIMSTKSGNIEERTGAVSELSFDYIGDVARAYSGITLEYHVGTELAAINNTLRLAKKVGTPDLVNLATALKTTIEADLRQQIDQSIREYSFLGRILQNMEANYTRSMLSGLIKALAETVTMMPKVAFAYPKIFANAYSRNTDRVKSILDVIKSTHKDRAGLQSAEIVMFDSPLRRVATLRNLSIQEKVISTLFEKTPLVKSLNDSLKQLSIYPQRFADILVTTQVVVEAFAQEFEKITGKKLDEEALINDANYRAENQNAIKKARAYADQLGTKVANIGSRGEKAIADRDMSLISRAQGFMRSFPANEEVQFKSAVRTIVDSALERIGVENQRRGNFESGRQAAGFIVGQLINQGGYFILRQYLLNLFMNLLIGMFGGDEEDEFDFEDAATRAFADMVMTNLFGRLRTVQKLAVGLAFNLGLKEMGAIGGDENPFYQMNISRYTYVPSLLRNFGAVGAVGAGVMEAMYKIMDASEGKDVKLSNKDKLKLMSLLFSVPAYQELYKAAIAKDKADESQSEEAPRAKRPSSGKKMSLPKLPKLPKLK